MIDEASCLLVRRNVAMPEGTRGISEAIVSSEIGPGPLGIAETNPSAFAPQRTAISASSILLMQQIFTRVFMSLPGNGTLNTQMLQDFHGKILLLMIFICVNL
jgi:hypothetical protein